MNGVTSRGSVLNKNDEMGESKSYNPETGEWEVQARTDKVSSTRSAAEPSSLNAKVARKAPRTVRRGAGHRARGAGSPR